MNRPWMPLYPADYLADTGHLTTAEHGAYLLLIMHYWMNGSVPTDDRQLGRIARMSEREWKKAKPNIQSFFVEGWKHKRVEFELTESDRISKAGRAGGLASARARKGQRSTNDPPTIVERPSNDPPTIGQALPSPSQSPSYPFSKKDAASAAADAAPNFENGTAPPTPEAELFKRGKAVLGNNAGGLISNLIKAKGGNVALARAAIETASTKQDPREYIGAVMRGDPDLTAKEVLRLHGDAW